MNSSEKRRGREAAGQSPEEKKRAWGCRPATVSREITAPARAVRSARPPRPALEPSPTRGRAVVAVPANPCSPACLDQPASPALSPAVEPRSARHLPPARRPTARTSSPSKPTAFPSAAVVERKGKGKGGKRKETDSNASEAATCGVFFVTSATCGVGHGVAMCGVDPMEGGARRVTWCSPVRLNRWPALHFFDWTCAATGITGASQASLPTAYNTKSTSETTV